MSPVSNVNNIIHLNGYDLALAGVLILFAGIISFLLKLDLEKKLALAASRAVIQLLLVGYILRFVFNIKSPYPLLVVLLIMIIVASYTAVGRSEKRIHNIHLLTFSTLVVTSIITTFTATSCIINVSPWYQPRYVLPLMGMVLGNTMTGISLCLDHLLEEFYSKRKEIEMELSLGATKWEAARNTLRSAVRRGMIPMINSMMVVGIVSLPGMMTGQILAGSDPIEAVKYQIVVLFMITTSTALGCIITALLIYQHLFNKKHQLLTHRIIHN